MYRRRRAYGTRRSQRPSGRGLPYGPTATSCPGTSSGSTADSPPFSTSPSSVGVIPRAISSSRGACCPVEPGDTDGAAERLALLATDPALRARLGESGRAYVRERYSVERLVDDVDRLYRSLLAEKGIA